MDMAIEEECIGGFMARGGRRPELRRKAKDHPLFNKRKPAAAASSSSSSSSPNNSSGSSSRKKKRSRTGNDGVISDADNNPTTLDPDDAPRSQKWGSLLAIYARLDEKKKPDASSSRLLQPRLKTSHPAAALVPSSSCQSQTTSHPAAAATALVPSSSSCQSQKTSHPAAEAALVPSSSCLQSQKTSHPAAEAALVPSSSCLQSQKTSHPAAEAALVPSSSCLQSQKTSHPAAEAALVPSSSCLQSQKTSHPAAEAALVPSSSCLQSQTSSRARTILAVLMENKILPPAARLSYRLTRRGPAVMQGTVTSHGNIACACGCGTAYTVADFAAHARAGAATTQRPSENIFLGNRRSLSECLVQLMRNKKNGCSTSSSSGAPRVKRKCGAELDDGDGVCSVCADGGDLVICQCCPSAFHLGCVGLEATPEEDWFCPSCRCPICDSGEFEPPAAHDDDDDEEFTDKTVIYCDQCERQFHVGCIKRNRDQVPRKGQPWLCNHACSNIFSRLQGLVGSSFPTSQSQEGISFTLLRSSKLPDQEEAMAAEEHAKLTMASDVLHECFVTLIEPHTQSDLTHDIVFNRESWLTRLNFRGFYVVGLEKGGELITVGTLRVYGNKVAELPLVGTRFAHRRQGMCHLLMKNLEMLLGELGVEKLVLPAVPELLQTWTGSFGFQAMTQADKMEIADHSILYFQGTTMCQKSINDEAAPQR